MQKKRSFIILYVSVLVLFVLFLVVMMLSLKKSTSEVHNLVESLSKEMRDSSAFVNGLKDNVLLLTQDTSSIREVLRMPGVKYPSLQKPREEANVEDSPNFEFFKGVDYLLSSFTEINDASVFESFVKSEEISGIISSLGLTINVVDKTVGEIVKDGELYYRLYYEGESKLFILSSYEKEIVRSSSEGEIAHAIKGGAKKIENHYSMSRSYLNEFSGLPYNSAISSILKKKGLSLLKSNSPAFLYTVGKGGENFLSISFNQESLVFKAGEKSFLTYDDLVTALPSILESLDVRTSAEIKIASLKQQFLYLTTDKGFQAMLREKGLTAGKELREDNDYFYLDFFTDKDKKIGAFAIQKLIGEIYLTDREDVPLCAIKSIGISNADSEKKN